MQANYLCKAVTQEGADVGADGDLSNAVMVSLVPQIDGLPRHDVVGPKLVRRFCRGFINGLGGGMKEYIHCVVAESFRLYMRSSDGTVLVTPPDYELYL